MINYFTTVKSKLNIISFLTIAGFVTLLFLLTYYSSTQQKYFHVLDNLTDLRLSIINLNHISKEKAIGTNFAKQYAITHSIYENLHKSTDAVNLEQG